MRITKEAYEILNDYITGKPPETGGIVGSSDDNVVTHAVLDKQNDLSVRYGTDNCESVKNNMN